MAPRKCLKPERSDTHFLRKTIMAIFNERIGLVCVTIVAICLMVALVMASARPQRNTVIDGNSGKTYTTISHTGTSEKLIERQLCYYSVEFCEDFFNYDYMTIQKARQKVLDLGHPVFIESLGKNYLSNDDVKRCLEEKSQSFFTWEINPKVTMQNDPYYSTFMSFQRSIKSKDITKEVRKYNVKLDWGRLANNIDYSKRPHSLVLLKVTVINEGSIELNDQINKIN